MKSIVVYNSVSGFTKKYALWIAEAIGSDIVTRKECSRKILDDYDTIIYGGNLFAVNIGGLNLIKKNMPRLAGKQVIIFACGASPWKQDIVDELLDSNFSSDEKLRVSLHYLRGGYNHEKQSFIGRFLMNIMKKRIEKKPESERSEDEKGILDSFKKPVDFTDRQNIEPILAEVKTAQEQRL